MKTLCGTDMSESAQNFHCHHLISTVIIMLRILFLAELFRLKLYSLVKSVKQRWILVIGEKIIWKLLNGLESRKPLRYLLFPGSVKNALSSHWFGRTGPEHSGLYKVRIKASGIRPAGSQPVHLSIGKKTSESTVEGLIEFDVTASEDKPEIYEFEVFIEMPARLDFCVVSTREVDRRSGGAYRGALGQ